MTCPIRLLAAEILETRIAPAALYFVQSDSLAVHDADGSNAQDTPEEDAAALDGNAVAVLLKSGDQLIFDLDNDDAFSAGDTLLAKITGGQAMLYFADGAGPTAGGFDKNELTGAAVSNGFSGSFFTDINGSVVTALDADGKVNFANGGVLPVLESSIASLHVTGQIAGNVLAGRAISDVEVGGKLFNTGAQFSVSGMIATGTKTAVGTSSFNNGMNSFATSYAPPSGASGGNITKVNVQFGAALIAAGDGADIVDGKAGAGGSVSGVEASEATGPMSISAGKGGNATTAGTGGAGGSIIDCMISEVTAVPAEISFVAGAGGSSAKGNGGAGGGIKELTVTLPAAADAFTVQAGDGGVGGDTGSGGAGGALATVTVQTFDLTNHLKILAGNGAASGSVGGKGGKGGAAKGIELTALGATIGGDITIAAGNGGGGFAAGVGGMLSLVTADVQATAGDVKINAGNGGEGNASAAHSTGGGGGALTKVQLTTKILAEGVAISAGSAGRSVHAAGKAGGKVQGVEVTTLGAVNGAVELFAGIGGSVLGTGNGGKGGAFSDVTYTNRGGVDRFLLNSILGFLGGAFGGSVTEDPANNVPARGNGGQGGAVSGVVINSYADIARESIVGSGTGGPVETTLAGSKGNGGGGGALTDVIIHDFFAGGATDVFGIYAGSGKNGAGDGGKGGHGGIIKNITLDGASSRFQIGDGVFVGQGGISGSGAKAVGGNGGLITNVHGTAGVLDIVGSRGGDSAQGKGGNGSSVTKVNVTTTGAGHFLHWIAAGNGGNGADEKAGAGGSVKGVKNIGGDIGDFTKTFGLGISENVQSGISAGQGGSAPTSVGVNGSVLDITAGRIATIIAGRPAANAVSSLNGVAKLQKINATVIGADTGIAGNRSEMSPNGGTYNWTDGDGNAFYNLGTGDTAIDGLVLVNTVAPLLPVVPLKLIVIA